MIIISVIYTKSILIQYDLHVRKTIFNAKKQRHANKEQNGKYNFLS